MTTDPNNPTPLLTMTERQAQDVTILDLEGSIIMGGASAELNNAIRRLIEAGEREILLNLAGVKYIDSSGVGVLVSGSQELNQREGHLKLLNLSQKAEEVLALSSLLSMFEVYDDESEALKAFKTRKAL